MNATPALVRPRFASDLEPHVALWATRLSICFHGACRTLNNGMNSEELRQIIGITPLSGLIPQDSLAPLLRTRAEELVRLQPRRKNTLRRNTAMLGKLLDLSPLQIDIVTFFAMTQQHPYLHEVFENTRVSTYDQLIHTLVVALKARETDIREAMARDSILRQTRLVTIEVCSISGGINVSMPQSLRMALFTKANDVRMLMDSFLELAPASQLDRDDFKHLGRETELLTQYLASARSANRRGVNILIYGPPGTGKTEYARWLAGHLKQPLYQVKTVDDEGNPIHALDRLSYFQLSQCFLQKSDTLVLFDEIEEVFPDNQGNVPGGRAKTNKLFINHILEENPIPAIWISNEIDHIDKAYLRRFDFSFEMGVPSLPVRRQILHRYLDSHGVREDTVEFLTQFDELSPAQVEKAAKILHAVEDTSAREDHLALILRNSQSLLKQKTLEGALNTIDSSFHLDYLNADCDLPQLVDQLQASPHPRGALCFYGPPGTGKTALANYLARQIGRPLVVRRASDLIASYVGETEQNLAKTFRGAQHDGAILLIDEADSFLHDREEARHSWEITAVNEMLTQMELFSGLLICTTNRLGHLDPASLRRFAFKIKFHYLTPEQCWQLFQAQAGPLPSGNESAYRQALNRLSTLTAGDFATVRRQSALLNLKLSAEEWLHRLTEECRAKPEPCHTPMGFTT